MDAIAAQLAQYGVPLIGLNVLLQQIGLPIPAGRHEVLLRYRAPAWIWALPLGAALVGSAAIVRCGRSAATGDAD